MREVIVRIRCDSCRIDLNETTVIEVKVQMPKEWYVADLCTDCADGWVKDMRPVKRKVSKVGTSGPHACDLCDRRFSTPVGLTRHKGQIHKASV